MARRITGLRLCRLPDGRDELSITYGPDGNELVLYGTCLLHEPSLHPGEPLVWRMFMHAHPGTSLFADDPQE